jgi:hypothetical protein
MEFGRQALIALLMGTSKRSSISAPTVVTTPPLTKIQESPELTKFFSLLAVEEPERSKYKTKFAEEAITTPDAIKHLDKDTLKELGVKQGHMYLFEEALNAYRGNLTSIPPSCSPPVDPKEGIARVVARIKPPHKRLFFASHNWGEAPELLNHRRVTKFVQHFQAVDPACVWFDSSRLSGSIAAMVTDGIDESAFFLAFITKDYVEKVKRGASSSGTDLDWCSVEFTVALNTKPKRMIAVVMEPAMRNTSSWQGPVGILGPNMYVDLSSDDLCESAVITLCEMMETKM